MSQLSLDSIVLSLFQNGCFKLLQKISETINPNIKHHEALLSSLLKVLVKWNDIGYDYCQKNKRS